MVAFLIPTAIAIAARYFPMLATKIAGDRAGDLAREVVDTATTIAGLPNDASTEDIIAKLEANRNAADELRLKFEMLNQQEAQRIIDDRQGARAYQISVGSDGRHRGNVMLIVVSLALLVCIVAVVVLRETNSAALGLITTVAGACLKMFSDAFAFEFGSSRGSKEKDNTIDQFQERLAAVARDQTSANRETIREQQQLLAASIPAGLPQAIAAELAPDGPRDFVGALIRGAI